MIHHAHFIRLRYHGPTRTRGARWSATWEGWPTDDGRPVRRFMPYTKRTDAAQQAAFAFVNWLNTGPDGGNPAGDRHSLCQIDRVTIASMGGSELAVLVKTRYP